jgi:hypothetical protein
LADKPEPYRTPAISDFQRNLDAIIRNGEQEAATSARKIQSGLAARGLAISGLAIKAPAENAKRIHGETLNGCMNLIDEFTRGGRPSQKTLAETARPRLDILAEILLTTVADSGAMKVAQQVRVQYAADFQQRLDAALKDIEIGFIDGRRITAPSGDDPPKLGEAMILKPTFMGMGVDIPKAWKWVQGLWERSKRQ